jgi:hypothetical protein
MKDRTSKIIQWLLLGMMGISALLGILFYAGGISTNLFLYWGYFLMVLSIAVIILVVILQLLKVPKGSLKFLFIIIALVVLGIISYAISGNEFSGAQLEKYGITVSTSKLVGAALIFTYFVALGTILTFIYTTIYRFFK